MKPHLIVALLAATAITSPLAAESAAVEFDTRVQSASGQAQDSPDILARFAPAPNSREHRIDYQHWDEALGWMVIPFGPSLRQGAPRVDALLGTRRIYGHESRYRLEGNRVAFSYMTPQIKTSLTEYRQDLERVGTQLDLASLPRNEQLAFWLNLHNVAVIEALALQYPLAEPYERQYGPNGAALDDAKLVTIDGIALSPRDIREGIVYPNWSDAKVAYGFWRGVIGGPSIQRLAFNGSNVDALLSISAEEFVNSLRGIERWSGRLQLSPIYEEMAPFYFQSDEALRSHLSKFAREDVKELVLETRPIAFKRLETDVADLSRGERDPGTSELCSVLGSSFALSGGNSALACNPVGSRVNRAIQRLMDERSTKLFRAYRKGIRNGMVIYGDGQYSEDGAPPEVK